MNLLKTLLPSALVALVFGFLGAWLFAWSGLGGNATREWLLANPQILPEMAEAYQANEARTRSFPKWPKLIRRTRRGRGSRVPLTRS
jgi:hypothetical protein